MNSTPKNTIVSSIFALIVVAILGGMIYTYSYFYAHDKSAEELVKNASEFVKNKKQLAIDELKINLAQARTNLQKETEKLTRMERIVDNDVVLRESVAGARIQAKIEAKRAALETVFDEWRQELESISPQDDSARTYINEKYTEIVNTHMDELHELVDSPDSGLTDVEIDIANQAISDTEWIVDDSVDTLSEPPADASIVQEEDANLANDTDTDSSSSDSPNIVITDEDVEDQGSVINDIEDEILVIEEQLSNIITEDENTDDEVTGDSSDTGSIPPPQPHDELNPNRPKLLQGSDL